MAERTDCVFHYDHENRITKCEKNDENLDDRLTETEKIVFGFDIEMRNAFKNIAKLPESIDNLNKSFGVMEVKLDKNCNQIDSLTQEFNEIKNKVSAIDEEGKINTRKWYTGNFSKIQIIVVIGSLFGGAALAAIISYVISLIK